MHTLFLLMDLFSGRRLVSIAKPATGARKSFPFQGFCSRQQLGLSHARTISAPEHSVASSSLGELGYTLQTELESRVADTTRHP
jgi:hypothetical protein